MVAKLIKGKVAIGGSRIELGAGASSAPAIANFGKTLTGLASRKLEDQRVSEANLAAQSLEFERDEQGHLVAPTFPEEGKLMPPNLYSRTYREMTTSRYKQQIAIDSSAALSDMAIKFSRDPEGFESASDAYGEALSKSADPAVMAELGLEYQIKQVQYHNFIKKEKAAAVQEEARQVHLFSENEMLSELGGCIQSDGGAECILLKEKYLEHVATGRGFDFYTDGAVAAKIDVLDKYVAKEYLAKSIGNIDFTERAHAEAVERLEGFIKDGGMIEMPGGDVEFSEFFPSSEERLEIIRPLQQWITNLERMRSNIDSAERNYQRDLFMNGSYLELDQKLLSGDILLDSQENKLREITVNAVANGDTALLNIAESFSYRNVRNAEIIAEREATASDQAVTKMITLQQLLDDPELMAGVNKFSQGMLSHDVAELLSPVDASGLGLSLTERNRMVQRIINITKALMGGGTTDPQWRKDINAQYIRRAKRAKALADEWVELNGQPEGLRGRMELSLDVQARMGKWDLDQTENHARFMDEILTQVYGEIDWSGGEKEQSLSRGDGVDIIDNMINEWGIIPLSLTNWMNGVFANSENIDSAILARALDFGRHLFEAENIKSYKLHDASGLKENGVTLRKIFTHMPASTVGATKQVREMFQRGMSGEPVFMTLQEYIAQSPANEKIFDDIDDLLDGVFESVWKFDQVEIPHELRNQVKRTAMSLIEKYDPRVTSSLSAMLDEAVRITLEDNNWTASKLGFSSVRGDQPFMFQVADFTGLKTLKGLSFDIAASQNAPESFYKSDTEQRVFINAAHAAMKDRLQKQGKFVLGENAYAEINRERTEAMPRLLDGSPDYQWQIWLKTDGETRNYWPALEDSVGQILVFGVAKEMAALRKQESKQRDIALERNKKFRQDHRERLGTGKRGFKAGGRRNK